MSWKHQFVIDSATRAVKRHGHLALDDNFEHDPETEQLINKDQTLDPDGPPLRPVWYWHEDADEFRLEPPE